KSAIPPQKILKCNQLIEADIAAAAEQETADTEDDEEPHRTPTQRFNFDRYAASEVNTFNH
ncbi:unnamed protein product, partial [Didymodactylos carnosus]